MKTYILKYPVYNTIDFPEGTIIELINERMANFKVIEGNLNGEKGFVANGLDGWLIENTHENVDKINQLITRRNAILEEGEKINEEWESIKPAKLDEI